MINIENLTKIYESKSGKVTANNNISLSVQQGEIVGLLGHNGAGKTTLVNQISGIVKPTSGEIIISGQSVTENHNIGRFLCSIEPQAQLSLGELSPLKAVTIMGLMRGGKAKDVQAEAMRLFESLDMTEWINKESTVLSGGIKRLTAFCMTVNHSQEIIILDEPTNDVDPVRRRYLWAEIKRLTQRGKSVILVTHNVAEVESVVDRVIILHNGRILADGTSAEIRGGKGKELRMEFMPSGSFIAAYPSWAHDVIDLNEKKVFAVPKDQIGESIDWVRALVAQGAVYDYSLSESTLEDVYVKMTAGK